MRAPQIDLPDLRIESEKKPCSCWLYFTGTPAATSADASSVESARPEAKPPSPLGMGVASARLALGSAEIMYGSVVTTAGGSVGV